MNCPKCGSEDVKAEVANDPKQFDYIEVELTCNNGHVFFARLAADDFIDTE